MVRYSQGPLYSKLQQLCSSEVLQWTAARHSKNFQQCSYLQWITIGSNRRPETKQGIEGKIVRFRSGRVRDMVGIRDKDRRSEAINFGANWVGQITH